MVRPREVEETEAAEADEDKVGECRGIDEADADVVSRDGRLICFCCCNSSVTLSLKVAKLGDVSWSHKNFSLKWYSCEITPPTKHGWSECG